jgi:hypothetical protein
MAFEIQELVPISTASITSNRRRFLPTGRWHESIAPEDTLSTIAMRPTIPLPLILNEVDNNSVP